MREYDSVAHEVAPESCLRDQADSLTSMGHDLHSLLDSLEDRLFDPVPREVAKNAAGTNGPSAQSIGQNLRQTRKLTDYGLDRLRSILGRI